MRWERDGNRLHSQWNFPAELPSASGDGQLGQGQGGREGGPTILWEGVNKKKDGSSNGEGVNKKVRRAAKTSATGSGGAGPLLGTRDGQTRHLV